MGPEAKLQSLELQPWQKYDPPSELQSGFSLRESLQFSLEILQTLTFQSSSHTSSALQHINGSQKPLILSFCPPAEHNISYILQGKKVNDRTSVMYPGLKRCFGGSREGK